MLRITPRASNVLDKCFTTKSHPGPVVSVEDYTFISIVTLVLNLKGPIPNSSYEASNRAFGKLRLVLIFINLLLNFAKTFVNGTYLALTLTTDLSSLINALLVCCILLCVYIIHFVNF